MATTGQIDQVRRASRTWSARRLGLILIFAVAGGIVPVWAQTPLPVSATMAVAAAADPDSASAVRLLVGHSAVVNTGSTIARVSLTSADVADALVTTQDQLLVHGKTPGTISMFVWNRAGAIQRYEIIVQRDIARLGDQMRQLFPSESIRVESNGHDIVVAGNASTKEVADKAVAVAAGYVEKKDEVVNLLQVQGPGASNQVLLRVRFAEVSRSALTELGSSFFTSPTGVKNTLVRTTTQQFAAPGFDELEWTKASDKFGADVTGAKGKFTFSDFLNLFLFSEKYDLGMMVRALQNRGLFQSLAEPNLVAQSGKEASFLAGGEIPVPVVQGGGNFNTVTVEWKEFGIRLNFTPTVSGDRVQLKVRPEVSTLDFNNSIVLQGFRIPALSTRRTETELELQDGQTFAIAGLLNNSMTQSLRKIPGIGDIPILGLLFKSKAAQKDQTELVVMITPQILGRNSPGVTQALPRNPEPFLPPLPPKESFAPPPPAFQPAQQPSADATSPVPLSPVASPSPAPLSPAAAAAAVSALTPKGPTPVVQTGSSEQVGAAGRPALATPAQQGSTTGAAATTSPTTDAGRPLTAQEQKTLERARREEQQKLEADRKAKAEEAKRAAKQAEVDARRMAKEQERQEKLARDQAKRDAEAAKKAQAAAKTAAEAAKR